MVLLRNRKRQVFEMASAAHAGASPKKRSHSEFESDQISNVKENGTPADDEGKVVHSHLFSQ